MRPKFTLAGRIIKFRYRNWRGEEATRWVIPWEIYFGMTEYHPEPQWLLSGYDIDRKEARAYALKDILE